MSDDYKPKKPQAVFEPGTLDNTRKNIGSIDAEEAARMTKVLGGEIMTEKSAPVDYSKLPKKAVSHHASRPVGQTTVSSGRSSAGSGSSSPKKQVSSAQGSAPAPAKHVHTENLPPISAKDNQLIDKLMMSMDFGIKRNFGFFNFIRKFQKDGTERVMDEFAEITLKAHIDHINAFITVMKTFITLAPDSYKAKIQSETDIKFKFLRKVATWNTKDIKVAYINLEGMKDGILVADLIPFIKQVYRQIITVYYLGEPTINKIIKDIYADLMHYPKANQEKLSTMAKQGITEWMYIYTRIAKGLYPLIMRMIGSPYEEFPRFFVSQVTPVLNFLGLKKFDLLLPEKKIDPEEVRKAKEVDEAQKKAEQKKKEEQEEAALRSDMTDAGIKLLCRLFPGAGFDKLDSFPDMFPYFDPLYDFDESFMMVSPQNPLQVTIVLSRIIEDMMSACNYMKFIPAENEALVDRKDMITQAISEWPLYREDLFDKNYGAVLKNFVNQTYTQPNFGTTQMGKKVITELYWKTKYYFLPQFSFEQLLLERPINDNKYIPLAIRSSFLRKAFSTLTKQISASEPNHGGINGFENPWELYHYELESPVSKRLNVLLNAKNKGPTATATNANVVKYLSCLVSVLDWWINAKGSPAYHTDPRKIYRTLQGSNEPAFSVEMRKDQNKLFADGIRNSMSANQ